MMIVLDNHYEVGVVSLLPRYFQIQYISTHVAVDGNVAFRRTSMSPLAKIVSFAIIRVDKGVLINQKGGVFHNLKRHFGTDGLSYSHQNVDNLITWICRAFSFLVVWDTLVVFVILVRFLEREHQHITSCIANIPIPRQVTKSPQGKSKTKIDVYCIFSLTIRMKTVDK